MSIKTGGPEKIYLPEECSRGLEIEILLHGQKTMFKERTHEADIDIRSDLVPKPSTEGPIIDIRGVTMDIREIELVGEIAYTANGFGGEKLYEIRFKSDTLLQVSETHFPREKFISLWREYANKEAGK